MTGGTDHVIPSTFTVNELLDVSAIHIFSP